MSIFKLPTHKITLALVGLFLMAGFAIPSVSFGIAGDPDDRATPPPTTIPLDPRLDIPIPVAPATPVAPVVDPTGVVTPAPVVVENPIPVTDTNFVWLRKALHEFAVTTFGVLLGRFGEFFDWAVNNFVIGFGDRYENRGIGFVIDELWGIIRNIFNLTLIFGLVYIGFQMILGLNNSAQRSIGYLVAAALLVNFSLFITKFVVDFSNLAATQIYQAMVSDDVDGSISTTFTNIMGLSGAMNTTNFDAVTFGYIFGLILIFVVSAFVFAAGGIMILLRFIGLNLYLVFSPLLFLGWVFPSMNGYSKKYWSGFLGKAFFAPAFMFMLYLSLRVMKGYDHTVSSMTMVFDGSADATSNAGEMFAFFVMGTGFLLASLVVAQKMGATGADTAIAVGQRLRKGAQGIVFRNTVGRGAQGLKNVAGSTTASRIAGAIPGGRALQRSAFRSFDSVTKYGAGGTSLAQRRSADKATDSDIRQNRVRIAQSAREADREAELEAQLAALEDNTTSVNDLEQAMNGLGRNIREMSNDERAGLGHSRLTNHHVAVNLTDSHIDNLASSGNYSPQEIAQIRDARRQAQINIAQHGFANTSTVGGVVGASNASVRAGGVDATGASYATHRDAQRRRLLSGGTNVTGNLPPDALARPEILPLLTPRIIEERMRNGLGEADRIMLRDAVYNYSTDPATPATTRTLWNNWEAHRHEGMEFFR